mgnify:CR=1 FL=1
MRVCYGGVTLMVPEIWNVETETYTEPDGRECAMIDISAVEGDPRSIVISYGPMPEGSDALMEAGCRVCTKPPIHSPHNVFSASLSFLR